MKLTRRDKRALVFGGVFTVVVLLYLYGISPLIMGNGSSVDEIESTRQLLANYRQAIAMEEVYKKAMEDRKKNGIDLTGRLLSGTTPALAAADLSNSIRSFAEECNAYINRENVNPATKAGSHQKISLQLSITSDVIGLRDFLYRIQSDEKLLDVESLTVTSRVTRRGRPRRYSKKASRSSLFRDRSTEVELNVTMVVSGYIAAKGEENK